MRKLLFLFAFIAMMMALSAHAQIVAAPPTAGQKTFMTLPTGATAIWGMPQQQGYNGPCMLVTRASDSTTKSIGFVNGYCDVATAFTFGTGTTLSCTTLYDQSGNGNNLPNCGGLNPTDIILSKQGITNDLGTINLPAGMSFNRQSETAISVASTLTAGSTTGVFYQLGSVLFSSLTATQEINSSDTLFVGTGPGFVGTGLYGPTTEPMIAIATSSASGMVFRENAKTSSLLAIQPAGTVTGGYAFSAISNFNFYGSYYLLAIYPTVLNSTQISSVQSQLYSIFNILTAPTARLVEDGDSITEGTCATFSNNRTHYLDALTKYRILIRNIGVFGQTGATGFSHETANIINSYDASLVNLVEYSYGTNDLAAGTTGTDLFNNTTAPYVVAAKAKGYQVIVGTIIYRTGQSGSFETERQTYNGLVRSNAVANGYTVADYDVITQFQNPPQGGITCDGTHPTSTGYALMGTTDAAAVNSLLP